MKNTNLRFLIIFKLLILPLSAYSSDSCPTTSSPYSKKLLAQNDYIDISADNSTLNNRNEILLQGNVELLSSDFFLSADNITFNRDRKNYHARGDVRYLNEFISTTANEINIKDEFINAKNLNFEFQNESGNGSAEGFEGNSNKQIFTNSIFTNCPSQNPDWKISSKQLILDKENNFGLAKDAKLEFFDIPILYLPYIEWPLEGRGSGFLSPSFSKYKEINSNTSENSISIPYYLNIAKDKDFLISLDYMTSRGSNVSTKYRQLLYSDNFFDSGYFEFQNNYLPKDRVTKNDRWLTKGKLDIDISEFLKFSAENFRVSDKRYFKEINHNFSDSDLYSFLKLNYSKNDLDLDFEYNNVQYVDGSSPSFIYAPRINTKKTINIGNSELNLSLNAVKFKNNSSSFNGSNRLHYEALLKEKFEVNAFEIEPEIGLLSTHYDIKGADSVNRNILKFGVDTRIELEKELDFIGAKITQSFIPRLKYNFVEKENQSNINNFDTEEFSLDALTLYQTQDFTGLDKISSSNSLVYGFDTEFFNSNNGEHLFSSSISQKRNIDDEKVGLDGNFIANRNFSDIYTSSSLDFGDSSLNFLLNYDPYKNRFSSSALNYAYYLSPKKLINFGYTDDIDRALNLSASYPISNKISVFGSLNKNLSINSINKNLYGISYETCCWELTLARFDDNDNNQNNSLEFELVFKDLGSTSNSLKERIKSQIPNYLKNDSI